MDKTEEKRKLQPRGAEEIGRLTNRLRRIRGQIEGIEKMIEENRYCADVLTQIAAVESAVRAFGYLVFEEHLRTCVCEKIRAGEDGVIGETVEIAKLLR